MSKHLTDEQLDQIERGLGEPHRCDLPFAHIATMDPATVLQLVAEVKELRESIQIMRGLHSPEYIAEHPGYGIEYRCVGCNHHHPCPTLQVLDGDS